MTVRNNYAEDLRILIGDLEDAVHIRIAEKLDKSGALTRYETDLDRRRAIIYVGEFESEEVSSSPITGDRAAVVKIFQSTGDLCSCDGNVGVLDIGYRRFIDSG